MHYVLPFLLAMVVTMAWLPVFARVAERWRIVDRPGERKVHLTPIPRIGGAAMAIGVLVAAVIAIPLETPDRYFLLAAVLVAVFGGLDDRLDLDYRVKLFGQLLAAAIVIAGGAVQIHPLTLDDQITLPSWAALTVTTLFLIGITNAINLADGLDGLAGGTTLLSLCALAILAYSAGQVSTAALALAFAGAVLGFLRFNTFPALLFMGDAGSQLLGFAVGVLSLRATQSGAGAVSVATPLLLLALPILDTLSVMVQRVSEGRSPFSADRNHIHHKLLVLGFRHHEAVMAIYIVQANLFLLAYLMRFESDAAILGVVTVFFASTIVLLHTAVRRGWSMREPPRDPNAARPAARRSRWSEHLPRWTYGAVTCSVAVYSVLVMTQTVDPSSDVKLLLLGLLALAIVWLTWLRRRPLSLVEKAATYVTVAVLVYLDTMIEHRPNIWSTVTWGAILVAAAGTALRLRLSTERRLELTPLDLIVLFVALVVPSLPGSLDLPHGGALAIAKVIVLFYAVEVVTRADMPPVWLRLGTVALLAALVARPMI